MAATEGPAEALKAPEGAPAAGAAAGAGAGARAEGERPLLVRGRAFPVVDAEGQPIDDIDTDQIFHNAHLAITARAEMGKHAFGNLEGYEDFPARVKPGDVLVVGKNFGAGSSRQQAVDCFLALGVSAIVGESFGAIYFRNAVNAGLPLIRCAGLIRPGPGSTSPPVWAGDILAIDLERGAIRNETAGRDLSGVVAPSAVQVEIYKAGNLFRYGKGP